MRSYDKNIRYGGIDVAKLFMAVCVIAIHTRPTQAIANQMILNSCDSIVGMAVPFFFLCSGFFMFTERKDMQEEKVLKAMKKVAKLYLLWTGIYLPISIWGYIASRSGVGRAILSFARGFLFIGENKNSWMLWYLLSSIFAIFTFYVFVFKLKKSIFALWGWSIILFLIALVLPFIYQLNSTNQILSLAVKLLPLVLPNGRMLIGLFYIVTGVLIAKYKPFIQTGYLLYLVLLIVALILNVLVNSVVFDGILVLFSSLFFFCFCYNLQIATSEKSAVFREMSTVVYFVHMLIFTLYSQITANVFQVYGMQSFLVVAMISLAISILVLRHKENKWVGYIFK